MLRIACRFLHYDRPPACRPPRFRAFGLLELSRSTPATSLGEKQLHGLPRCSGIGHIRGTESSALHILRIIQEEANEGKQHGDPCSVPVDVATFLLNEKRADIHRIESP